MRNSIRRVAALLAGITTVATGVAEAARPARAIAPWFSVVNAGSGLCLQPAGGSNGLGEPIVQVACDGSRAQQWGLSLARYDRYLIVRRGTSLCMDVRDARTVVQQWSCDKHVPSMRWAMHTLVPDLYFKVISEIGSRCLDVAAGSLDPGARLQIHNCSPGNTNPAQIFEFRAVP